MLKKLKQEGVYLLIAVIACIVLMKIAFYNESTVNVAGIVLSFFFVFVLPGFAILIYWHEKLDFLERIIAGTVLGIAVIGISSYYLGILGWNVNGQHVALPLLVIILALGLSWKRLKTY
ncbi:MAG TPA: hypothetical protein VJI46_03425 [Candidatus Nanoarchaeia archaeon]|nr:hypothetical protein [Candidatus Nanoarchaeia archaeon]